MQKIAVIGGAGFIGINMIYYLYSKKKFKLISIDKLNYASNKNDKIFKKVKNYKVDISDNSNLKKIICKFKPNYIINFAAETHVDRSIDNPKSFINSNIVGLFNLIEISRKYLKYKNFRFLQVSTDEVFGDIKKNCFSKETDKINPTSPYAASKACSDLLIKSYIKTYNFPAIITNCCNNFGPYQYPEKFIPKSMLNLYSNKPVEVYGTGMNEREWIYVTDHCKALYKLLRKGKAGESYNIGSGIIKKNIEIVKLIITAIKKNKHIKINDKIILVKDRPSHDVRYALNSQKIKKELNWKCETNFQDGLIKTINYYLNSKWIKLKNHKSFSKRLGLNE